MYTGIHFSSLRLICVLGVASFLQPGNALSQQVGDCLHANGSAILDANNVRATIHNGRQLFYRSSSESIGYEVPAGSGKNAIWGVSTWIAGIVDGELRSSSSMSRPELWAGPINDNGDPPINCDDYDRVFKVRTSDIQEFIDSGFATADLLEWPTGLGAPTVDRDHNPIDVSNEPFSERSKRIIDLSAGELPNIKADQSIWWITNDRGNEHRRSRTEPLGIELHGHAYAASNPGSAIDSATLYSYRIVNKNSSPITDAYVGIWFSVQLGFYNDNYLASDSSRGMGIVYNFDNDDEGDNGYGIAPPAVGGLFLDGPVADADLIDNNSDGQIDELGERLGTTSISWFHLSGGVLTRSPTRAQHFYNYLQGLWVDGHPFTVGGIGRDFSEQETKFVFSGDPVTGEFWSQLNMDGSGERADAFEIHFLMSSGPFTIQPNAAQDFTFAIVWARGTDNFDSIVELRKAADLVKKAYSLGGFDRPRIIPSPPPTVPNLTASLSYNFPDPFSDTTTIRYRVPSQTMVKLVVHDVLGREVMSLVNQVQEIGEYLVKMDGSKLPSGVYYYRIEIGRASAARSMTLVK